MGLDDLKWLSRVVPIMRVPAVILGVLLVFATVTQSVFHAPLSITHALARIWDHWLSDFFNLLLSAFPVDLHIDLVEARVLTVFSVFFLPFSAAMIRRYPDFMEERNGKFFHVAIVPIFFVIFAVGPFGARLAEADASFQALNLFMLFAIGSLSLYALKDVDRLMFNVIMGAFLGIVTLEALYYLQFFGEFAENFVQWTECQYGDAADRSLCDAE